MTARVCKYGCGTMLEGFDEENRKFLEAGSGGLHTKERCQEAKAKRAEKDDHGNETVEGFGVGKNRAFDLPEGKTPEFVDHTAKGQSKVRIFFSDEPGNVEDEYAEFQKGKSFAWARAQFQMTVSPLRFAIALYYEETK